MGEEPRRSDRVLSFVLRTRRCVSPERNPGPQRPADRLRFDGAASWDREHGSPVRREPAGALFRRSPSRLRVAQAYPPIHPLFYRVTDVFGLALAAESAMVVSCFRSRKTNEAWCPGKVKLAGATRMWARDLRVSPLRASAASTGREADICSRLRS